MQKEKNEQYEDSSECEDFEDYGPEGYHPVYLGERFNTGTYQVIQKVGWGHFSTVWLVQSLKNPKDYFALKIQRSKDTHAETAVDELSLLKVLMAHQQNPQWQLQLKNKFGLPFDENVDMVKIYRPLLLIDNFVHYGMHGKHYCSVFELMGPNLLDLIQHYEYKDARMPLWLVKKITIDVLVGMIYMHQYAKMIHTDIKPENIMVKLPQSQLDHLVSNIKSYKKKPMSMKYLNKLQSKNSEKNKKKYDKKKQKKKAAKQAATKDNQIQVQKDDPKESQELSKQKQHELASTQQTENHHSQQSQINTQQKASKQNQQPVQMMVQQSNIPNIQTQIQQKPQNDINVQNNIEQVPCDPLLSLEWKQLHIKIDNKLHFKIADFGNATMINKHFTQQIQTRQYRSPEVIVGSQYNQTADIWSLACMVYQMMTNTFLFKPKNKGDIDKDEDHLYKMIQLLGSMPKLITSQGTDSRKFFNKKGELIHGNPKEPLCISQLLHEDFSYQLQQSIEAQNFLEKMLTYDPSKRISARECLKSEWLWK